MAPPRKDAVHRYFVYDNSSNTSLSELCRKTLKGRHTTNLKNHLATKHTNEYQIVGDLNTERAPSQSTSLSKMDAKIENLKRLCVRLVTVHGRPLSMMEDEAFQDIINIAADCDSAYKNINVEVIKNKINVEANENREIISNEVENDMENHVKLVGGKPKLKEGVVPHKFACQKQTVENPTSHDVEQIYIVDSIPRVQDIVNEPLNDVTRDENMDSTEEDILETTHKNIQVSRTQEDEPMSEAEEEDTEQEHEVTIKQEPVQVFATQLAEPSPIRNCKRLTRTVRRRIREQPRPQRAPDTDSKLLELLRLLRNSDISRKKDECDIFGEYIASSLRKHDERTQSMIKQAINNILFEQEMKKYSSSSSYAEDNTNPLAHTAHILIPDN